MAIFRPGAIVGAISGNLGGLNFVAAAGTPFVRMRPSTVNRKTKAQLERRTFLPHALSDWYSQTDDQRQAFDLIARLLTHTNTLGVRGHLNGFQLYNQLALNQARYLTIPSQHSTSFAAHPSPYQSIIDFTAGGPFNLNPLPYPQPPVQTLNVWVSRPVRSRPIKFFKYWRSIGIYAPFPGVDNIYANVSDVIGDPGVGEIIGIKLAWLNRWKNSSPPVILQTTVHA